MKFVHFGCWAEHDNIGNIEKNLDKILENDRDYNMVTIAGDNYYPKKKDGKKYYNEDKFRQIYSLLRNKLNDKRPKFLLLGNHEFDELFAEDESKLDRCHGLDEQVRSTDHMDGFVFFKNVIGELISDHTLIIMIDSNLYAEPKLYKNSKKESNAIKCYAKHKILGADLLLKEELTLDELRKIHEEQVVALLKEHNAVKNIIFIGHHPISGCKKKLSGTKVESEFKSEMYKFFMNLGPYIKDGYDNKKIYYLAADIHCYQKSHISINSPSKHYEIVQHTTGTGGADADVCVNDLRCHDEGEEGIVTSYDDINNTHYGYLRCIYEDGKEWKFEFIYDEENKIDWSKRIEKNKVKKESKKKNGNNASVKSGGGRKHKNRGKSKRKDKKINKIKVKSKRK